MSDDLKIKQALLQATVADGVTFTLAVLVDDRCAILRDGQVIHVASGDRDGIDDAVARFMKLSKHEPTGMPTTAKKR